MKYLLFLILALFNSFFTLVPAQTIIINPEKKTGIELTANSLYAIEMNSFLGDIKTLEVNTPLGLFTELIIPEYTHSEVVGSPSVPVLHRLLDIPAGADISIEMLESHYRDFSLQELGYHQLLPSQPPQMKSQGSENQFRYDTLAYARDLFTPLQLVTVDILGYMRGLRIGRLNISPVQYNPVSQVIRVYDEIKIRVHFQHPDFQQTRINRQKNANLFFSGIDKYLFNSLPLDSPLDTIIQYPVKYVIVSHPMFQEILQPFIAWKKKKGFTVIEAYTNNPAVGSTAVSIKNYLQVLYNAATPDNPPPSFALFAGDVAQVPTFSGTTGSHPTDLYYCEYTNDHLPELFYGRFSATTLAQLQSQIDKTLEYEQYTMPDPSFLNHCVMIAGMDATYGATFANGQINYGTSTYFNAAHGLTSHTYFYPGSGSQDAQIIQDISNGCCYANYTAHGSSSGWADPTFTTANVPSLSNLHKYPLLVGNACLTNKFNDAECFGESLLRASGKGAIGYIGASNNTYWYEDFYWSVGAKPVSANPVYSATALGAYDRTFHDQGEPYPDWFMTQGQMVYAGNLAVLQGSPSYSSYYWEIYHLMGDPSLMVYFSQPPALTVAYSSPLPFTSTSFTLITEPYAYAAVSSAGILHGAAQADASGIATISLIPFSSPGVADVVVTKQNRQPYTGTLFLASPTAPMCIYQDNAINDNAGNNNGLLDYGETVQLEIGIQNAGLLTANNITVTLSTADPYLSITDDTQFYGSIPAGGSVSIPDGFSLTVAANIPDGHMVWLLLTVSDGTDSWNSNFSLVAHAPILTYNTHAVTDPGGNQNGKLDPGETAGIQVTLQNSGSSTAMLVSATLESLNSWVTVISPVQSYGDIAGGTISQQQFSVTAAANTPPGTSAYFSLSVTAANGITATANFSVIVGQVPVLLLNFDGNNTAAGPIQQAITANDLNCSVQTTFPVNLDVYASIFVCLGCYDLNHVLGSAEGAALANYLNNGGKIYLEGGDTWYFDPQTDVRPMFNINGLNDGNGDLGTLHGQNGTFTEGMTFTYNGDNSWIDRISPTSGSTAFTILKNGTPDYGTAVAYDGGTYKTIGSSHEFAGLVNGSFPSTRNEIMKKYLEFFGLINSQVVSGFTASPTSVSQGGTVVFQDTSSGNPTSWNWHFPGAVPLTSTLQHPAVVYPVPGTYPVTLSASNAVNSSSISQNNYITVTSLNNASVSIGSYSGCADGFSIPVIATNLTDIASVSLTISFNSSALTFLGISGINPLLTENGLVLTNQVGNNLFFSWFSIYSFSLASGTLFTLSFYPNTTGSFPVEWNNLVSGNCEISGLSGAVIPVSFFNGLVQLTAESIPASVTISVAPSLQVCENAPLTFTAYGTNTGLTPDYQWKINGIIAGNGNTFSPGNVADGDVISCELISGAACASGNPALSNFLVMNIFPLPVVHLGNDTILPTGTIYSLDAGPGYAAYQWSTGETTQSIVVDTSGIYSVSVTSSAGCSNSGTVEITIINFNSFGGTLTYANAVQTPLGNTEIKLKSGSQIIAQTYTDTDGTFLFTSVVPGTYQLIPACTKAWGGVNATDGLLMLRHFVGYSQLTGLYRKAGDVDASNVVNSLDALISQRRSVYLINYFTAGDWAFLNPTVNFSGQEPLTINVAGLCYGDVNGSFLPPSLASGDIQLDVSGELLLPVAYTAELPVRIETPCVLGAVSLFLELNEKVKFLGLRSPMDNAHLVYHLTGNTLGIEWIDYNGALCKPGDVLFYLTIQRKDALSKDFQHAVSLLPQSEFADPEGNIFQTVKLSVPAIMDSYKQTGLSLHPNPFSDLLTIGQSLPEATFVKLDVFSADGKHVAQLLNSTKDAGEHSLLWNGKGINGSEVENGVYYLRSKTVKGIETIMLIKSK